MKKIIFITLCILSIVLSGCTASNNVPNAQNEDSKELNILGWEGYIPNEVIEDFERETGITVNYSNFNVNDEMFAKLKATNGGEYDIAMGSDYIIDVMVKEGGLIKELDKSRLENFKNIDASFQGKYYDPENKYVVPYAVASALIVYDSERVPFEIKGYADLWRDELKNSVVLLDGSKDIIGLALQKNGYSVNETDETALTAVGEDLKLLKKNVVSFDANTPHEKLISGEASVGYMFGSQAVEAEKQIPSLKYVYPEEGMGMYIDNIFVPYNCPNEENAYKFLNYILDGKVSAKISELINYTNTNSAAKEFLSKEFLDNKAVNIPDDVLKKAEVYKSLGDTEVLYNKIWTEFKSY